MKNLPYYLHTFTSIGAERDMPYIEIKRVQMVNLIVMVCLPLMLFFAVINWGDQRYILSALGFSNALLLILVLILQHHRKYGLAKIILLGSSFIIFYFGALVYRNGGEYFLLAILIVSMLLYDSDITLCCIATIVILAILSIYQFTEIDFFEEPVPRDRALFNTGSSLVFIVAAVGFFKNIIYNNTKQIEEQRFKLQTMNRDKERVFSIVAHDMRSPMATLGNMLGLFRNQILSGDISEESIVRLQQQIVQQNIMLENLLEWSSSSMRGIQRNLSTVNIKKVIEDIICFFEPQYTMKKLSFGVDINLDHPVYADRKHLTIIFRNLISNAIKFSHIGGRITIYSSEDNGYLYIHVKDEGVGMEPHKYTMLFNTVQQRSVGTDDEPGAGLGLALCNELISLNKGTIHVQSEPNGGSMFTIGLPKESLGRS